MTQRVKGKDRDYETSMDMTLMTTWMHSVWIVERLYVSGMDTLHRSSSVMKHYKWKNTRHVYERLECNEIPVRRIDM